MRGKRAGLLFVLALCSGGLSTPALAQQELALGDDPLFTALFPPELIMQHRRAIGLTDEQRDAISQLIGELQGRVVQLQWDLLDDMQRLTEIMSGTRVDLDRSLDQLGNVLETENEIKQRHIEMLVRIKNLLSAEQQATLERLRAAQEPPND
jgi:Spy/CpxP family protein refolding chaperone